MNSFRRTLRIAVPVAAALAAVGIAAPRGHAQTPGPRTIDLTENGKATKTTFVDAGKKGAGVGDGLVLRIPLVQGGTATAACTVIGPVKNGAPPLFCTGVFARSDGDIMVAGRVLGGTSRMAVTGGTGAYAGARGTLTSTDTSTGADDVFVLL
jgi:hypothetical protein